MHYSATLSKEDELKGFEKALELLLKRKNKHLIASSYYKDDCACAIGAIAEECEVKGFFINQQNEIFIGTDKSLYAVLNQAQPDSRLTVFLSEIPYKCLNDIQFWNDTFDNGHNSKITNSKRYKYICNEIRSKIERLKSDNEE